MVENLAESLINEAISLTSMDDSSDKISGIGEKNNLHLSLAKKVGFDEENG